MFLTSFFSQQRFFFFQKTYHLRCEWCFGERDRDLDLE